MKLFGSQEEAEAIIEEKRSRIRDQVVCLLTSPEKDVSVDTQRGPEAGVPEHRVDTKC